LPLGYALSDKESELGRMFVSFQAWTGTKEKTQLSSFSDTNKGDKMDELRSLVEKDLSYHSMAYQIYGFHWCNYKHLNYQFKMRKNLPLVANCYPLRRGKKYYLN
jgi:hypothetical protein